MSTFIGRQKELGQKPMPNLQNKIQAFEEETKTRKAIFLTMITTYGLQKNNWSADLVRNDLDMNIFFE
jgi:uncharacterized protein